MFRTIAAICILSLSVSSVAFAQDVRQEVANGISQSAYSDVLDNWLYTRFGDSRGKNGAEHDLARDNIRTLFESYGLPVEFHTFPFSGRQWENVVATQVGTDFPDRYYVIGAHYDSVDNPGADDNASGVAGILEIARVLSQFDTAYTIKYIAFDMEEQGLVGSDAYVQDHLNDEILGMYSLDMIAYEGGVFEVRLYGSPYANDLKSAFSSAAATYSTPTLATDWRGVFDASDHAPFQWVGIPAVLVIEDRVFFNPHYHTQNDSVDVNNYIDYGFATEVTRAAAVAMATLAEARLSVMCAGDLTGDGYTGFDDFSALVNCWDQSCGDLNDDGTTDFNDFSMLVNDWGCGT